MRTYTKRIRVIEMTSEEIQKFQELVQKAAEGQTVHAAEAKLADGSFLAVAVNDHPEPPDTKAARWERQEAERLRNERTNRTKY